MMQRLSSTGVKAEGPKIFLALSTACSMAERLTKKR
jgi:hypothetical protein